MAEDLAILLHGHMDVRVSLVITAFPALGINNFIVKLNHPQLVKVNYRSLIGPVKAFSSPMPQY